MTPPTPIDTAPEWRPSPHPEPPPDLSSRQLEPLLRDVPPPFFHCSTQARGPLSFNRRSTGRFNAPAGEYGVAHLSTSPEGAFIERFGQSRQKDGRGVNLVTQTTLNASGLCLVHLAAEAGPLRLIDLTAHGPTLIGADGRLCTATDDPGLPQRWALALWRHPQRPDGLLYRARHDLSRVSIAVFDRAAPLLLPDPTTNLLAQPDLLGAILRRYGFGLDRGAI